MVVDTSVKVTRTYSTRDTEKLLGDAMKTNKSTIVKRRKFKKGTIIKEKNIYVVYISEVDKEIDPSLTEKRREEVFDKGRTKSSRTKSKSPIGMK